MKIDIFLFRASIHIEG